MKWIETDKREPTQQEVVSDDGLYVEEVVYEYPEYEPASLPRSTQKQKKLFFVECRWIGEKSPWFEHSREWHRHAAYKTLKQAEQAAECLNKETKGRMMLRNGKVIPPRYEFRVAGKTDGLMETAEIMADKELMAQIKESEQQMLDGETEPWESVKERLGI